MVSDIGLSEAAGTAVFTAILFRAQLVARQRDLS